MRILIVSQYFWPENFRINDLATDLIKKGNQVTVLTGVPNYPDGHVFDSFKKDSKSFLTFNGVKIARVPMLPRGQGGLRLIINYISFMLMACILGPWRLRGQDFDIVFVNQLSPVTVGIPGILMARIKNVPVVMWVLDLWPDTLHAVGVIRSTRLLAWVGGVVSLIYKHCDLLLVQSKSFIPNVRKLAPNNVEIDYLPSWAEDIFQHHLDLIVPEIPQQVGSFNVMFAGNIGEAQDFPCILAAAQILKEQTHIRWLIVGDGRMQPWVEKEIHRRGLVDHVLLLGRYPIDRMPAFYKVADALLVTLQNKPIFNITIPGKLQSYLAAGRPIVGALNGEGAAIVRESASGFVCDAGDYIGLADAVLRLSLISEAERRNMGKNGEKYSALEFQRESILEKFESKLRALVSARGV